MTKDSKNFQSYIRAIKKAKYALGQIIFLLNNPKIRNYNRRLNKWSNERYKWEILAMNLDDGL